MQISLALNGQTPSRVLGEGVQHVVEEPDARVHADGLGLAGLGGVATVAVLREQPRVRVRGKRAAVEVEGELDLCLVGVAGESGPALGLGGLFRAHRVVLFLVVRRLFELAFPLSSVKVLSCSMVQNWVSWKWWWWRQVSECCKWRGPDVADILAGPGSCIGELGLVGFLSLCPPSRHPRHWQQGTDRCTACLLQLRSPRRDAIEWKCTHRTQSSDILIVSTLWWSASHPVSNLETIPHEPPVGTVSNWRTLIGSFFFFLEVCASLNPQYMLPYHGCCPRRGMRAAGSLLPIVEADP